MGAMLFPAAVIATTFCVVSLLVLRPLAVSANIVDRPGGRKKHIGSVPTIGGVGMFFGFCAGALLAAPNPVTGFLIAAGFFLVLVGLVDDRFDLPPSVRLSAQFGAVMLMVFGVGLEVSQLGDPLGLGMIRTGPFSLLVTVLLATAVINALNMTDGMDGLAGSMALIAFVGFMAVSAGNWVFTYALVGAAVVLGFLVFNFPIASNRAIRTFMGDSGSTFLGFLVACFCIGATQPPDAVVRPAVALCFVAVPLYDLTSCFFRRILSGRSPFAADRNHFHHVLQDARLRRRSTLLVMTIVATVPLCGGLAAYYVNASEVTVLSCWIAYGVAVDFGFRAFRASRRAEALTPL